MIRAFIAAEISDQVRSGLGDLLTRLKRTDSGVRWVRPAAIHLTLRFLGNVGEDQVDRIAEAMALAVSRSSPIEVEVGGWGTFPEGRRPRVIWVGLKKGGPELGEVFDRLEEELVSAGLGPADKRFSPHLTLGRVKSGKGMGRTRRIMENNGDGPFGAYRVDRLVLFQSQLNPSGAVYTRLAERTMSKGD